MLLERMDELEKQVQNKKLERKVRAVKELEEEIRACEAALKGEELELEVVRPRWEEDWGTLPAQAFLYRYDLSSDRLLFCSSTRTTVQLRPSPFDQGSFRYAYYAKVGHGRFVFKRLIHSLSFEKDREEHQESVLMYSLAALCATEFNKRKPPACPSVRYVTCRLYEFVFQGNKITMLGEDLLPGPFEKYNNNTDYVSRDKRHQPLQTFSHFSFEYFSGKYLVVDIQGTYHEGEFLLTDPAVHTEKKQNGRKVFGCSNHGEKGFNNFFSAHRCNEFCSAMKLEKKC